MKAFILGKTGLIGRHMASSIELVEPEEADYLIHAGGYGQPSKFMADEIVTISVNTTKLIELLGKMKKTAKFLFLSTSEIYSGAMPPYKEDDIGTTTPQHKRACYIESKRCGEAICMAYRRLGYDVKVARLSLAYGGAKRGDGRVLNQFVEQALTTGKIQLLDKGEAKRTYIYIEDAVSILWDILLKGTQPVYNVGGISKTTIAELAYKIAELTGAEVILGNRGLDGAPDDVSLDMSLVFEEFGKREFTSLEEGLKKTIAWTKTIVS